jgi:tRNA threonylcarbamoyladenosine biosynthesis protein TsaE
MKPMITSVTRSLDETQNLAKHIGAVLHGGEVFELVSDVGGGKTAFVKGLARGLGVDETVQSPTFTISRIYHARNGLELHHFDFYRLPEAGIVAAELAESLAQPNAIVAIEWGEVVHNVLPAARATISITSPDDTTRRFSIELPKQYDYLLPVLQQFTNQQKLA